MLRFSSGYGNYLAERTTYRATGRASVATKAERLSAILEKERGEVHVRLLSSSLGESPKTVGNLLRERKDWKNAGRGRWLRDNSAAFGFALSFTSAVLLAAYWLP